MSLPPSTRPDTASRSLTDRAALRRNRARATETVLHAAMRSDIEERLKEVNRRFTKVAVVTGLPAVWAGLGTVVPDDDVLALEPAAFDLVIHAGSLHWSDDPVGQMIQCRRALQPDGMFLACLFGGQTLAPLRTALAEAESALTGGLSPRVLPMGEIRDLGGLLQRAGFALPVADSTTTTLSYRDGWHVMRDLRAMGEANAMSARSRNFTRRRVLSLAVDRLRDLVADADGRILMPFETVYLTGWAPSADQPKPLRPGSAAQRLADALGSVETPIENGRDN